MILNKLKHSFVFRIALVYKLLLRFLRFAPTEQKDDENLKIVMLCGLSQIQMLEESIFSILKSFKTWPSIYVFTDKDLDRKHCQSQLRWLRGPITVIESNECINHHLRNGNKLLAEFAGRNPMGLKMAAILQVAEKSQAVLYSDTDVLWFKDPAAVINVLLQDDSTTMALSEDFQCSYDHELIKNAELSVLLKKPCYCAGILFLKSFSAQDKKRIEELLELAVRSSNHFTEQTIFAYINKLKGSKSLNSDQFVISLKDQFRMMPSINPRILARHYVGPVRHQFWRDALAFRFR